MADARLVNALIGVAAAAMASDGAAEDFKAADLPNDEAQAKEVGTAVNNIPVNQNKEVVECRSSWVDLLAEARQLEVGREGQTYRIDPAKINGGQFLVDELHNKIANMQKGPAAPQSHPEEKAQGEAKQEQV